MSTTIDNKVVSMQFDNKQFEANVKESMSTLEKLKHALKLDGANKGFETLQTASNKIDFSKTEIAATKAGFHIQDVFEKATRFLEDDVARRIVDVGKKIVSDFTITPIKTGFQEYELKMDSVQTILASTGESLETVNRYLDELNKYSDQTIYSFQDMTSNIGKFTNAGVKLDDAVAAIKGVSNEAAVSGANAQEASRAMYNFAQALSAGYVKLIDWKSIENANMATVEFKNELIKTGVELGTLVEKEGKYITTTTNMNGNISDAFDATHGFNEALNNQWMTTDVLTKTLGRYADETTDIGKKAKAAATEVKTFSMMMDTLKEAAQSGWAQTWELIFGDFEEAKALWTELSDRFGKIIDKSSNARNALLTGALDSKWDQLSKKINEAGIETDTFLNRLRETAKGHKGVTDDMIKDNDSLIASIKAGKIPVNAIVEAIKSFVSAEDKLSSSTADVSGKLEEFQTIVDKVWNGDFGNGAPRVEALTKAGYDYATVQSLVNKTVDGHRLTEEELAEALANMSEEQLKNIGYTEEQADAIKKLAEEAEKTGTPLRELMEDIARPSGRDLLIDTFRNVLMSISKVCGAVKKAWVSTFPKFTSDNLYNIIAAIHALSEGLVMSNKTSNNLTRTLKGLFAILDIVRMVLSAGFRIAFQVVKGILAAFNLDILDVTAAIGDMLVKFRDWIKNNDMITKAATKMTLAIKKVVLKIIELYKSFMALPLVQKYIGKTKDAIKDLSEIVSEKFSGGKEVISGFIDRVRSLDGISLSNIKTVIKDFVDNVLGYFIDIDGSVDTVSSALTTFKDNTSDSLSTVNDKITTFKDNISSAIDWIKEKIDNIDFDKLFALITASGLLALVIGLNSFINSIGAAVDVIEQIGTNFANLLGSLSKCINAFATELKSRALLNAAIAIGILVAAIFVLTLLDTKKVWKAILQIGAIVVELGLLMLAVSAIGVYIGGILKASIAITSLTFSLILMSVVCKLAGSLSTEQMLKGLAVTSILGVLIGALIFITNKYKEGDIEKATSLISKIGFSLLQMTIVFKIAGTIGLKEIWQGVLISTVFGVLVSALVFISNKYKEAAIIKTSALISKVGKSLLLMAIAFKVAGMLNPDDILKGIAVTAVFAVLAAGLIGLTHVCNKGQLVEAGKLITSIGSALMLMSIACKIAGFIDENDIYGIIVLCSAFTIVAGVLIFITKFSKNVDKASKTITSIGVAMMAMALALAIASMIDPSGLDQAISAFMKIGLMFSVIVLAAGQSKNVEKTIQSLSVALVAMVGCLVVLSFLKPEEIAMGMLAMIGMIGMFAILIMACDTIKTGEKAFLRTAITLGVLSGVIVAMAACIFLLGKLKPTNIGVASICMTLMIGMFILLINATTVIKTGEKQFIRSIGTLAVLTVMVASISGIIALLAKNDPTSVLASAAALSIMMLSLAAVVAILGTMGPIGTSASAIVPVIIAVAAAFALFSISITAIGAALLLTAKAFSIFGNMSKSNCENASAALSAFIKVILLYIPKIVSSIAMAVSQIIVAIFQALISICQMIITEAPIIVQAFTALLSNILLSLQTIIPMFITTIQIFIMNVLQMIQTIAPELCNTVLMLIETLLTTIAEYTPSIVQAGFDILLALLQGIEDNIGEVTTKAINIVLEFMNAVSEKLPEIIQAGIDFMLDFIEGLGQGIEDNSEKLRDTMISFCDHLWNAFKDFFGIHSPSTVFADGGVDLINGLINGIGSMFTSVGTKISELGTSIVNKIATFGSKLKTKGSELMGKLKDGITGSAEKVKNGAKSVVTGVVNKIKSMKDKLKNAGKHLMDGLKEGIENAKDKVVSKAKSVGNAITGGVKKVFGINSPSKVFSEIGKYLDEGLIVGLNKYSSKVTNTADDLGCNVIDTMSNVMDNLEDVSNRDLLTTPTIRPVVDMDAVKSERIDLGANISDYFTEPVNSLSKIISDAQSDINSSNNEVINAINGLREDINRLYESDDQEIALYVDSKKLATSLAKPMNRQLNILSQRGAY